MEYSFLDHQDLLFHGNFAELDYNPNLANIDEERLLERSWKQVEAELTLAEREPNQVGFDVQISPIPASFPLDILPICPAGKAFGLE